jgi:hypothetical protein
VEKKASQFKQNASIFYETSVNCTNLGTWQPGHFGKGEERKAAILQNAAIFFKHPCTVETL